ncbi:TetR/AcrR family transcriptional regulator C-terminal domain-containing protein [Streptomyces europaeiscabiei]|uniref:TetR/AcrR family transcriptional regulator C-terminal domain-containing protein n=1 Tax=Streptomyces europaeiscabiei TaxID=146819 RepID=UPI000766040B|nr:TetR/AcrR family transcriptional regulator C-terminal domain-containing protein [Streptomyces europaeiscabiei]MDX3715326.1 TetR/AcrR family transcriptional regulator C-terminal domain-containing protein [Streptomyces europaeiscabiei]MDX3845607.1 TetR/AcrR family transcriptional regulator C-terminal domain-containing protein [Streptomyces europaeiscabiei]MDX3866083.1 TetR/AcrR family transcriptional regulator C-terminal domain-containing protein [Streptomyces europaeiscabiei]MDX3874870.1 TetR
MPRPRTPLLDRRRIGAAALRLADDQGVLTIPALARKLGVAPSALYHHVSGRDEIVSLMREELALETSPGDWDSSQPWEQALEEWARSYRTAFATHPGAVPLLATAPLAEPFMHAMYEKVAELLLTAGFSAGQVMPLINAMESFVLGSALDLVAPPVMVSDVTRETAPHLTAVLEDTPTDHRRAELAFDVGLRALITGFRALLPR